MSILGLIGKRVVEFILVLIEQARSSHEKAVRLSVRPSIKGVICDKTKELSAIFHTT